ncbi:hypothetical protein Hanom_Chr05g00434371 [Helianthus anomalus]
MFYILLITNLPQISAPRSAKRNPNSWFTNPFPRVALKMPLGRSICRCGGMQGCESHYTSPSHHHHYLTPNHHRVTPSRNSSVLYGYISCSGVESEESVLEFLIDCYFSQWEFGGMFEGMFD